MTYQEMRTLCERLTRYEGRLTVLSARSQEPWTRWALCLRDHMRDTWRCFGQLREFAAYEQALSATDHRAGVRRPRERPLAELRARPAPHGASMTWPDVLRALDVLERTAPGWRLAALEATRPERGDPRYRLVLRRGDGEDSVVADSYAAFAQLVDDEAG
jgi:hypothetical protein